MGKRDYFLEQMLQSDEKGSLFRTSNLESGEWLKEAVCQECAKKIKKEGEFGVEFDSYATQCFDEPEEECPMCEKIIYRDVEVD